MSELRKAVLVSGASGDIGMAVCQKFIQNGYFVYAQGFSQTDRLTAFSSDDICVLQANLEKPQDVEAMFLQIDREVQKKAQTVAYPTTFVHAAGMSVVGLIQDLKVEEWDKVFAVNVRSAYLIVQKLIPHLLQAGRGNILFVSSFWGELGASCEAAYSASKGALNTLAKALAKELGPSQICVNALALGAIDTKMNAWMNSEEKAALCEEIALGRMGTVSEVADAVYFFAGDQATYFNGQVVRMDGQFLGA